MSRKPRLCFEGAFYHLTSRGDNKERIFSNNWDRTKILHLLKQAKERFCFKLHAYVLMRNHFHLLIQTTTQGTISQIMHYSNSNYTKYFNWSHQRTGHLFQGRFHSNLIDRDAYLLEVSRYVHLNPVRAGLVSRPEDYKWTSYPTYIGGANNRLVDKDLILDMISPNPASQGKLYIEFVNDGLRKDSCEFKERLYNGLLAPTSSLEGQTAKNG